MTNHDDSLKQAELSLQETETLLGADHPYMADKLEEYAALLKSSGHDLLAAANARARAQAIREKHGLYNNQTSYIYPDSKRDSLSFAKVKREFLSKTKQWCQGRMFAPRLLLLLWITQTFWHQLQNPCSFNLFKGLDLGIHELGHIVFSPFGQFITVAGGSLFQCLVPVISIFMFYRQKDFFAIAIAFGWLAINLVDVSVYIADARAMALHLVSPFKGGEPLHDWNYLLSQLNLLSQDTTIAGLVRLTGIASMLVCISFGSWICWQMFKASKANPVESSL